MTVIVGMNNVKIIILTKPISYLKHEEQSMDSCVNTYNPKTSVTFVNHMLSVNEPQ